MTIRSDKERLMSTNPGKIIRNVATLDLRTTTPEAAASIRRIDNVATVLYSPETAPLLATLSIGNVASLIKVPTEKKLKLINGQEMLGATSFANQAEPLHLLVSGQLIIQADVKAEDIQQGLGSLIVFGQLLYPEALASVIQAKLTEISGQMRAYRPNMQIVQGKLELSEHYLQGLADQSEFLVFGRVSANQVLPNELIEQKIGKIETLGRLTCHEDNAAALLARCEASNVTIIPAGFTHIERSLVLDANLLEMLPGKQIFAQNVRFEPDVTAEALDQAVEKLIVTGQLIAPAALRSTLARKCNLLETKVIFYEGELWLIENEYTLGTSRFDYLDGKATLLVSDVLTIDPAVEPALLAQRLHKVYNWGEIRCTTEQMSALQARLAVNEGRFVQPNDAVNDNDNVIGNAAYLAL